MPLTKIKDSNTDLSSPILSQDASLPNQAARLSQIPHKNGIVNGALLVWQDGTSFTGVANATYIADNLKYFKAGTVVHDATRVLDTTSAAYPGLVFNRARLTLTTAQAAMAAGDFVTLSTYIEGYQWRRYKNNSFTLQFLAKLPVAGTYCVSVRNGAADYAYVAEFSYTTANADQLVTVTVPAPPAGTWLFDNGIGADIAICLASGTTLGNGVVGWQTGNKVATANQVNSLNAAVGSTYEVALLRIDPGPVALTWDMDDFDAAEQLHACQRYFVILGDGNANYPMLSGDASSAQVMYEAFELPARMRTAPTVTVVGAWTLNNCSQPDVNSAADTVVVLMTATSAAGGWFAHGGIGKYVKVDARF